jgi:hypothetical protein
VTEKPTMSDTNKLREALERAFAAMDRYRNGSWTMSEVLANMHSDVLAQVWVALDSAREALSVPEEAGPERIGEYQKWDERWPGRYGSAEHRLYRRLLAEIFSAQTACPGVVDRYGHEADIVHCAGCDAAFRSPVPEPHREGCDTLGLGPDLRPSTKPCNCRVPEPTGSHNLLGRFCPKCNPTEAVPEPARMSREEMDEAIHLARNHPREQALSSTAAWLLCRAVLTAIGEGRDTAPEEGREAESAEEPDSQKSRVHADARPSLDGPATEEQPERKRTLGGMTHEEWAETWRDEPDVILRLVAGDGFLELLAAAFRTTGEGEAQR